MKSLISFAAIAAVAFIAGCANLSQGAGQAPAGGIFGGTGTGATLPGAITQGPSLIDILVGQLGINSQQALGGLGAIFSVAQQNLSVADFAKLSGAVPGVNQYLGAAPKVTAGTGGGLWGAAGAMLGGQNSSLGNLAALTGSFQSLGMNASTLGRFVPVVLQYVQSQGGNAAMGLLQNSLR